jgi:hypothetical protein
MVREQDDLTAQQNDYAIFLPAISSFYAGYIGRERHGVGLEQDRLPKKIGDMEAMNWLNPQKSLFPYRWSLYSAGHANLDLNKFDAKEDMIRNRDPNTIMLADSGGFQIAKGVWPGRWADPRDKGAEKQREKVLKWQMGIATYGMTMDIPTWTFRDPKAAEASGIHSYDDAVNATRYNNDFWISNRFGETKILNVLQGGNHAEADHWYDLMKHYSDPNRYPDRHFNGWGMGGQNMCDVHLVLKRLIHLIHDGLLEKGVHDWMHFLGTSKLEWACLLTDVQRAVRRYHNSNFTISFDCASPFLATANGQIYTNLRTEDRGKWSYQMEPTADDKKYATDNRLFRDAVIQDKVHGLFEDSPISGRMKISDVCWYAPGDLNKLGKEGRTSWDSFSYALMMGHNVWHHIRAVQEANRRYDAGEVPGMLVRETFDRVYFRDLVDTIFQQRDRNRSLAIIDQNTKFWDQIIGTRGFTGKKTTNAHTQFNALFDVEEDDAPEEEFDQSKLDDLENTDV